jgi:hypothetical protein
VQLKDLYDAQQCIVLGTTPDLGSVHIAGVHYSVWTSYCGLAGRNWGEVFAERIKYVEAKDGKITFIAKEHGVYSCLSPNIPFNYYSGDNLKKALEAYNQVKNNGGDIAKIYDKVTTAVPGGMTLFELAHLLLMEPPLPKNKVTMIISPGVKEDILKLALSAPEPGPAFEESPVATVTFSTSMKPSVDAIQSPTAMVSEPTLIPMSGPSKPMPPSTSKRQFVAPRRLPPVPSFEGPEASKPMASRILFKPKPRPKARRKKALSNAFDKTPFDPLKPLVHEEPPPPPPPIPEAVVPEPATQLSGLEILQRLQARCTLRNLEGEEVVLQRNTTRRS